MTALLLIPVTTAVVGCQRRNRSAPSTPEIHRPDASASAERSPAPGPRPIAAAAEDETADAGDVCAPSGWCWDWPRPLGSALLDVWGAGGKVWAVGGTVLLRENGRWRDMGLAWTDASVAVWGRSGDDVWVLSRRGRLAHWAGGQWRESVDQVAREAQSRIETAHERGEVTFYGVWVSPSGQVWAVGGVKDDLPLGKNDEAGDRSHIAFVAHFDGARWTLHQDGKIGPLTSVWGASDANVVACGGACLRWEGTRLLPLDRVPDDFAAHVHGAVEEARNWQIERARIQHVRGSEKTNSPAFGVQDFFALGKDDVWAVGETGLIMHWNGSAWSTPRGPASRLARVELHDVWAGSGDRTLAVGGRGIRAVILSRRESSWTEVPLAEGVRDLWRVLGRDGAGPWISGEAGTLFELGPGGPVIAPAGPWGKRKLWGLGVEETGETWIAAGRSVFHRRAPGDWTGIDVPAGRDATRMAVRSRDDLWAYAPIRDPIHPSTPGPDPVLVHWDGQTWSTPFSTEDEQRALGPWREVQRIGISPAGTLWLTDRYRVARAARGGPIESIADLPSSERQGEWYLGLSVAGDDDVWVSGVNGVYHFDGRTWRHDTLPANPKVEAIFGSPDAVFAVGPSAILRRARLASAKPRDAVHGDP